MKPRFFFTSLLVVLLLTSLLTPYAAGQSPIAPAAPKPEPGPETEPLTLAPPATLKTPASAIQATHIYTSTAVVAIPDSSCPNVVTSTIVVPDSIDIGDLNVGLWITHTWRSDLEIRLQAPDGTEIELLDDADGSADNLNVLLDDASPNPPDATNHNPPPPYYYAWWFPNEALNAFNFGNTAGTWTLSLCDDAGGDIGALQTWTLFFETGLLLNPPEQTGSGCSGSDVVYELEVVNTTGITQSFALAYDSVWPVDGPAATPVIPNNASALLTVTVSIPWAAQPFDSDVLTVTATGAAESVATATATTLAALVSGYQDYANVPRAVRAPSVVYYAGKLYKIGGYDGSARDYLDIYDIATDTWTMGANMPGSRYWLDCVEIGGLIYCAGGYLSSGQTSLYIYDPAAGTWTSGAVMPEYRYAYSGVALDGKYYVLGGYDGSYTNEVLVYDPPTDTWDTSVAPMNVGRRDASAGAIGGQIYIAGGRSAASTYLDTAEMFDPLTGAWTYVASMPSTWLLAADGVKHDRFLLLLGGHPSSSAAASNGALIYDALQDSWAWLPPMDHLLYSAEADGDGNSLWIASGRAYEGGYIYSPYTTQVVQCPMCDPVHDADFNWDPPTPMVGETVTFNGAAAGDPPITYAWDFGDGDSDSGQTVTHAYANPGDYQVTLTALNPCGQQVVQHTLTVLAPPMTMHVGGIRGHFQWTFLKASVLVEDGDGAPVPDAEVYASLWAPNWGPRAQMRLSNPNGKARFMWGSRASGTWRLCVDDLVKAGYTYEPGDNVITCKEWLY